MKSKGKNEIYPGYALDNWKMKWCRKTHCSDCTDLKGNKYTCNGRYAI